MRIWVLQAACRGIDCTGRKAVKTIRRGRTRAGVAALAGVRPCMRGRSRDGWGFGRVGFVIICNSRYADAVDSLMVEFCNWRAICVASHSGTFFGFGDSNGVANSRGPS